MDMYFIRWLRLSPQTLYSVAIQCYLYLFIRLFQRLCIFAIRPKVNRERTLKKNNILCLSGDIPVVLHRYDHVRPFPHRRRVYHRPFPLLQWR